MKVSSTMKNLHYEILIKNLQYEKQSIFSNQRNFLMCNSCFWFASFLNDIHESVNICPRCMNYELESMPIAVDEKYTFDYDPWHEASLEFWNKR